MGKVFKIIREYVGVLFGVAITAFGLSWFLIPSRIAAGGVSGLATVAYHLFDFPVGLTMLALISRCLSLALQFLGRFMVRKRLLVP